jgi:hypothetical protein
MITRKQEEKCNPKQSVAVILIRAFSAPSSCSLTKKGGKIIVFLNVLSFPEDRDDSDQSQNNSYDDRN